MPVPYENPPHVETITAATVVALPYPSRSVITAIKILQTSGTPGNFDVEIYNRDPTDLPADTDHRNFYVCPKKSGSAGVLLYFSDDNSGGHGYTFYSQDDLSSAQPFENRRLLYVKITPAAAGGKFSIVIASEQQVGGE